MKGSGLLATAALLCTALAGCSRLAEHSSIDTARERVSEDVETAIVRINDVLHDSPSQEEFAGSRDVLAGLGDQPSVDGVVRASLLSAKRLGTGFVLTASFTYPATRRGIGPDTSAIVGICLAFEVPAPPEMTVRQSRCPQTAPESAMVPNYHLKIAQLGLDDVPGSVTVLAN